MGFATSKGELTAQQQVDWCAEIITFENHGGVPGGFYARTFNYLDLLCTTCVSLQGQAARFHRGTHEWSTARKQQGQEGYKAMTLSWQEYPSLQRSHRFKGLKCRRTHGSPEGTKGVSWCPKEMNVQTVIAWKYSTSSLREFSFAFDVGWVDPQIERRDQLSLQALESECCLGMYV